VKSDGTVLASSGVTGVSKLSGTGFYAVTFTQDVSNCAAVATVIGSSYSAGVSSSGGGNTRNVFIWAGYDIFGAPSDKDGSFAIAVFC
jgi:hypothetical protein